ncbi:MAG: GTP-binding protein, partial [Treponema sp.]|nr:GTP-binding protein [Treponema sp.]
MSFTTELVRNVTIAGHGGTGKTTLFERLLLAGGVISKAETIESGKTVSDYTPEEIERKISINSALANIKWKGKKINLFDTPGSSDFTGNVISALRASEFAVLAVDAQNGVQIETVKLWRNLQAAGKPHGVFVTRMDGERADFQRVLDDVKEKFKVAPVPITIPMGSGAGCAGVIDVLNGKAWFAGAADGAIEKEGSIPAEFEAVAAAAKERLVEAAAEGNDELMEKYITNNNTLSPEETQAGLIAALADNKFVPAFAGVALKNSGLIPFLDFVAGTSPSPLGAKDAAKDSAGNEVAVGVDGGKPLSGLVIKTSYDQFSGKLSWVKIITGKLAADSEIVNVNEGKKERVGKLYICQGKKLEEVRELSAGDVGIITKSATLKTSDTLSAGDTAVRFRSLKFPEPVHSVAVNAASKKDDDKLGEFLVRAAEEDKTFRYIFNTETRETVISGMGE